jgi:hypothetical protein
VRAVSIAAAEFVRVFEQGWRDPGGVDAFLRYFDPYLDPAVVMRGPLSPDCIGYPQAAEFFTLLFDLIPDLHGRVLDSQIVSDEVALMSTELTGTIGSRTVTMKPRERVVVRDGRMIERTATGLPLATALAILLTPRAWGKAARLLFRVRWSAPPVRRAGAASRRRPQPTAP